MSNLANTFFILTATASFAIIMHFFFLRLMTYAQATTTHLDDVLVEAVDRLTVVGIIIFGCKMALDRVINLSPAWDRFYERAFFLFIALIVYILIYRIIQSTYEWYSREVTHLTRSELDDQFLHLFRHIAIISLTIIWFAIILDQFEVDISAMVTTMGITTIAVALATRETLTNMISGFFMMLDQPFRKGDRIGIQELDTWGDIEDIGLRATQIITCDNRVISIPNTYLANGLIVNYSTPDARYRISLMVGVVYNREVEKMRERILKILKAEAWILDEMPQQALFVGQITSVMVFDVRGWISAASDKDEMIDKLNSLLHAKLEAEGFECSLPETMAKPLYAKA